MHLNMDVYILIFAHGPQGRWWQTTVVQEAVLYRAQFVVSTYRDQYLTYNKILSFAKIHRKLLLLFKFWTKTDSTNFKFSFTFHEAKQ